MLLNKFKLLFRYKKLDQSGVLQYQHKQNNVWGQMGVLLQQTVSSSCLNDNDAEQYNNG